MSKADRINRRAPTKSPYKRVHIVSEGLVTETRYLTDFVRFLDHKRTAVLGHVKGGAGVPLTIVNSCVELRRQIDLESKRAGFKNLDEIWAVFDVDRHANINEALELARANKINCAISNPCFEIWGLLHSADQDRPYSTAEAQKALSIVLPSYHHEKNPVMDWTWCAPKVGDAAIRAARARLRREEEGCSFPDDSPNTNFDRLIAKFDSSIHPENAPKSRTEWY